MELPAFSSIIDDEVEMIDSHGLSNCFIRNKAGELPYTPRLPFKGVGGWVGGGGVRGWPGGGGGNASD